MTSSVAERVGWLRRELEQERDHYLKLARSNYLGTLALTAVTVGSSALAGILGLFSEVDRTLLALLALVPAITYSIGTQFKFHDKCAWHYRKNDALKALLRRLNYESPLDISPECVAEISRALSQVEMEMTAEWERKITVQLSEAARARAQAAQGDAPAV